jgi:hypothetical protein
MEHLLEEVRRWRAQHVKVGNTVEAAACAIRERALFDVAEYVKSMERERNEAWSDAMRWVTAASLAHVDERSPSDILDAYRKLKGSAT